MGRNIKPKWKQYRRLGLNIPGKVMKRPYPPGQHGNKRRQRLTEYGLQLQEKQKAKLLYGIMEKQFANYYGAASRKSGNTGEILMSTLEQRIDNAVYRAGFCSTRSQARQMVNHGHFTVNGRTSSIPSRQIKPGDVIAIKARSAQSNYFKELPNQIKMHEAPAWMQVDKDNFKITILAVPTLIDAEQDIQVNLIVEYYSR